MCVLTFKRATRVGGTGAVDRLIGPAGSNGPPQFVGYRVPALCNFRKQSLVDKRANARSIRTPLRCPGRC
ncbi:unnamed protein product, partial [Iphiclides podalirius]